MNIWHHFRSLLLSLGGHLRAVRKRLLSARALVFFLLVLIAVLIAYYALSGRFTPLTTDAYVQAYVIQVAARVEGQVVHVYVRENQAVQKGDLLFEIDRRPFQHRVAVLQAKLALAVQQVAQLHSELAAARAEDARLAAEEVYAETVRKQEKDIFQQEATTDRKFVDAVQKHKAAVAARERSQAQIRKAEQALEAEIGQEHALIAEVKAQLAEAQLNLAFTQIHATCDGLITNLQLREGAYAHVGQAVLTLIDSGRWLIVANFRENQLARMREGQPARLALRGAPGHLFDARVVSVGWGVGQGQGVPSGQLPDVKTPSSWVPPAQRFQVRLSLDHPESVPLRVGMTGSVAVYTEPEGPLNDITEGWHQVISWLYHL